MFTHGENIGIGIRYLVVKVLLPYTCEYEDGYPYACL